MRKFCTSCVLFLCLAIGASDLRAASPASIVISTSQESVKVGDSVILKISLTNTSEKDMRLSRVINYRQAEFDFTTTVHDGKDHLLVDSKYAADVKGRKFPFSEQVYTLKPNEQVTEETVINNLCDISPPGKYILQVQKDISIDGKIITVTSQPISINVVR